MIVFVKSKERTELNNYYKREGDILTAGTMDKIYKKQADEMNSYLKRLRAMPKEEARKVSGNNLMKAGIADADGKLTNRYIYSKKQEKR